MKRDALILCILTFFLLSGTDKSSVAQDSLRKAHSPRKAATYSAILPGLGQAYNAKYWKIPVLYAGFGATAYFINLNSIEYRKFRDAYDYRYAIENQLPADESKHNAYADKYSLAALLEGRSYYRRNRDLSYLITGAVYLLNIVDAAVDAYLFDYDISDEISLHVEPGLLPQENGLIPAPGLRFSFKFK